MPRILDVWFYTRKAGRLMQDDSGRLRFAYEPAYLRSKEPWPLSVSMEIREEEFDERIARPFFSGRVNLSGFIFAVISRARSKILSADRGVGPGEAL